VLIWVSPFRSWQGFSIQIRVGLLPGGGGEVAEYQAWVIWIMVCRF